MPAPLIDLQKLAGFPARCVNLRSKLGLPQSELARWLGVSTPCISLLEHGRRSPSAALFQLFEKLESGSLHHRLGAGSIHR